MFILQNKEEVSHSMESFVFKK